MSAKMSAKITISCLKASLLGSIAALAIPAGASAQETITDTRTTPVLTSTSGDLTISSTGSVEIDDGVAVTVDSDATVTHDGVITVGTGAGATGVLITGDRTFTYTQSGSITLNDVTERVDEMPADYAEDRFGLRVAAGNYTGDISFTSSSSIQVVGDRSTAFGMEGNLDGFIDLNGDFSIRGEGSVGVDVSGDVTGDVTFGSGFSTIANGQDTIAIRVGGDIGGRISYQGTLVNTGYEDLAPDAEPAAEGAGVTETNNAAQIALTAGDGFVVSGNVAGGFLLDGAVSGGFATDTPASRNASITMQGTGRAVVIDGGAAGINLGVIQENVIDTDEGRDETTGAGTGVCLVTVDGTETEPCRDYGQYGFINRGTISANGVYKTVSATGVYIANATIDGGIRNDGIIDVVAFDAAATAVVLGSGAVTPLFYNAGRLSASASGNGSETTVLSIEAGASVLSIVNDNRIETLAVSDTSDAVAIRDLSGSVQTMTNRGIISATRRDLTADFTGVTGRAIAMDFSANTAGVTIHSTVSEDFDPDGTFSRNTFGLVIGDIITGSGDDIYRADAGPTNGNLFFGDGNDLLDLSQGVTFTGSTDFGSGNNTLMADNAIIVGDLNFGAGNHAIDLTGGSVFRGGITNAGLLDIAVAGSSLLLGSVTPLAVNTLSFAANADQGSVLGISVNSDGTALSQLNAAGAVSIADGTEIRTLFNGAFSQFGDGSQDFLEGVIISSSSLAANLDQLILNASGSSPFLFEQTLRLSDTDTNDIILRLRRRSATEVGLGQGMTEAYEPVIAALTSDAALGAALFNTTTQADFLDAFNQVVAGPLDAPLAYARAQNNSVTSIVAQRVDLLGNTEGRQRTFWIQQQSHFVDRATDASSNGFDGGGFVIALGADTPVGPLDVLGVTAHLASSRYDEQLGEDFPFNRLTYGVDVYAAEAMGAIEFDGRFGYAVTDSESERNVVFGGQRRSLVGSWEGSQITANGRVRYRKAFENNFEVVPFASFDYVSLTEDAYAETGDATLALAVSEREADSLRGNVGLSIGKIFKLRPSAYDTTIPGTFKPRLTAGYSHEFNDSDIEATYQFGGGEAFTLTSTPESGAAILGADIDYENQYAKLHVGVSGLFGETTDTYTLRLGVGLKW